MNSRDEDVDEETLIEEAEYARESKQKRIHGDNMMDPTEIEQMRQ